MLPADEREFVVGDLEETFDAALRAGRERRAMRRWYWRAALGAIASFAVHDPADQPNGWKWAEGVRGTKSPDRRGDGLMKNVLHDARYGLRLLVRRPAFTFVAVLTLALGIGANAAIFSVAHTLLVKPLPYVDAERIVLLTENNLSRGWTSFSVSPPNFLDWRAQSQSFELMAAWGGQSYNYTGGEAPERLRGLAGTEGFFEILGGTPVLGRGFRPDEYQPGRNQVVMLSHGFWHRAFGGRPDVLEKTILLNGQPYTAVGVMHAEWRFGGRDLAIFAPRAFTDSERQGRGAHYLNAIGRLKPDVPAEQAQMEMSAIAARLEEQYPASNKGWGAVVTPFRDAVVGDLRPMLMILLGAVGLVLLIACANIANMHLARATVRAREMAIRTAIGAGRSRIVQQLLTESVILGLAGGAVGLLLAWWATSSFLAAYPNLLPRASDIGVDGTVLAFTAGLSLVTAVLFGVAPAFASSRTDLNDSLKEGGRGGSGGRFGRWLRSALVVGEVAIALVLLAGAGLLLRSFAELTRVEPGFRTEQRLSATTILPLPKYNDPASQVAFYAQALERLRALPGVQIGALTSLVPVSGNDTLYAIQFEGRPPLPPGQGVSALYYLVSPEYFETMSIPVLKGRVFAPQDRDGAPRVAVINDEFVRLHFPNEDPIGKRIRMGRNSNIVREIVGVVGTVKHYSLRDQAQAQMYEPFAQFPLTAMTFVLKTSVDPGSVSAAVRREIQAVDPDQPVSNVTTLPDMMASSMALPRMQTMLIGGFALIALLLAAVGLYGVMTYAVSQRTQEIGIRMALGARPGSVLGLVLGNALVLTGAGLVIGLGGALLLAQSLSSVLEPMLFQVEPQDVRTLSIVPVVLIVVAVIATLIPARRATRIDPIRALRTE
jgi:putative ABC transport system permease protein